MSKWGRPVPCLSHTLCRLHMSTHRARMLPTQSGCLERPFQPLFNVGIRPYRGTAMPARLPGQSVSQPASQAPDRSSHSQSPGQLASSALGARVLDPFSF
ncbi:hypothetical protein KVR01_000621 [Diaporthe batatas]|uniref:uncharacterized protein n=1 Tax=Diaporthe batatas TaxID=748121 RepID=UPI001D05B226|nr:uncharacterized protein KVR01_000621 [Diaporthe batatas]KAG8169876.1 hypothetical protein KVR01_000621 [Diaporthe batatas]